MFVPLIMNRAEKGLSLSRGEIVNKLIEYVNVIPTPQFPNRVREKGLQKFIGTEMNYLNGVPKFIDSLNEVGHRDVMYTKDKLEMMEVAIGVERRKFERINKHQAEYLKKLQLREEEVRVALVRKMSTDSKYLYALGMYPK